MGTEETQDAQTITLSRLRLVGDLDTEEAEALTACFTMEEAMSSHADTIRDVLRQPINGTYSLEIANRSLDALLAENQRLRVALSHYADEQHWSADVGKVYTLFEYDGEEELPWKIAREALAGDAE
jgi:negative regulator of sigma E activity